MTKLYFGVPTGSGMALTGTQALWTQERWQEWGVESRIEEYEIYLNYPEDHSLSLLTRSENDSTQAWMVEFRASLEEDVLDVDPTTGREDRIPTFHGYSASGNVTAPFVYVNYGTYQDYEDLVKANVSLEGKIAIAKYGGIFRGLKVKRAQELGMVGCLLYSDPGDDGKFTEENGYEAYPEGVARNPSSVQRGSAQFLSIRPGDPYVAFPMTSTSLTNRTLGQRPVTLRSQVSLGCPPTTARPRSRRYQFPMPTLSPF